MGLVDDKQGAFIVDIDAIEDLHEHPVFTHQGLFPEFGDDQPQKGVGIQGCEVQIDRVVAIVGQLVDKESEKRGFAQAGLPDDQCNGTLLLKEFESGQCLIGAFIAQQPIDGRFFGKGVGCQVKMVKKHDFSPFGLDI
jgi:hypothetical protein